MILKIVAEKNPALRTYWIQNSIPLDDFIVSLHHKSEKGQDICNRHPTLFSLGRRAAEMGHDICDRHTTLPL
jgi:hypothetical protein